MGAHVNKPPPPMVEVKVNGRRGRALLNLGCSQTLIRSLDKRDGEGSRKMWIRYIHGDVEPYEGVWVEVEIHGIPTWMRVGVTPELAYEAIIGKDHPECSQLLREVKLGELEEDPEFEWGGKEVGREQAQGPSLKAVWSQAVQQGDRPKEGV